jgi:hypothetical protein
VRCGVGSWAPGDSRGGSVWGAGSWGGQRPSVAPYVAGTGPIDGGPPPEAAKVAFALDALSDQDQVRVAILTGAGRVFRAGADIKARVGQTPQAGDFWQSSRRARESFHS